jgi:hypothetical protein
MSTWITSMAHFPKPHELSKRMPMSLIQTTLQFGSIVKLAVDGLSAKRAKHGCGGTIEAKVESLNEKIVWKCAGCADNGEISHWRGSGWDIVPEERMPEIVVVPRKACATKKKKKARRGTIVLSKRVLTNLKSALSDAEFDQLQAEARALSGQKFALDLTEKELKNLYGLVSDLLDFGPSRQRKMWDETLNAIGWALDDMAFADLEDGSKRK